MKDERSIILVGQAAADWLRDHPEGIVPTSESIEGYAVRLNQQVADIEAVGDERIFECQDCELEWKLSELDEFDISPNTLAPGDVVPYGICPECGAASHPKEHE